MKRLFTLTICFISLFACKKMDHTSNDYLTRVKTALQDSLSAQDYDCLNFSQAALSKVDSVGLYLLRVPFRNGNAGQFALLQTSKEGAIVHGRIIDMEGIIQEKDGVRKFQGHINILSLRRTVLVESPIKDGVITAFHQSAQSRSLVHPDNVLPEVVITYVIPSSGGISWSTWMNLQSLFNGIGAQPYYSFLDANSNGDPWGGGGGGGSTGGGSPSSGGGPVVTPTILIDFENQDENPELDLQKIIDCFNAIPNAGARSSIEILTDIPVDANPNAVYDLGERATGHVFLKLTKKNGQQQVERYIGFYPKSGYKATTYAPTASKLVSNEFHEYNASLSMNIAPERMATVLSAIQLYSARNYDADEYNCTNFALDVFNSVRGIGLSIPLYGIPGSPLTQATATPGGLYNKLKQMWDNNDPEKANIVMGAFKGWAGPNWGCN